ncbi:hypothetical protein HRS9139_08314 [Pyrenophora teres f. teres]|nr:hypothetical protein HRS9139_08314 [Pyrenophora teres f. teres]
MDPRYNWPPQAYANGQYPPYAPPQQQQQQQPPQQPNGYQQHGPNGYPQYPSMQMQAPQAYQQSQPSPYQMPPQPNMPRPSSQQYPQMQMQMQPPQPQIRSQPQVVIPARNPHQQYPSPMQAQPSRIRYVQVPVQRTSNPGVTQSEGSGDQQRRYSGQTAQTPPNLKPVQRTQSHQENVPRPQQRPVNTPTQNNNQHRAPLQPQTTPQQSRVQPQAQTPSSQYGSPYPYPSSSKPKTHPRVVIPSSSSSHQLTPTKRAHPPQKALPAELSDILLTAADEYIAAARGMASLIARERRDADIRQYQKLMSTAMGCMDTVLRDFNMPPREEAKLRLRYASLMIEETDIEATDISSRIEEILSKQISLCGRHRLQDLKFAALHLQARYQFKTNHRAGLKSLDKPIAEAETFQHIAWVYALRFLKVTLALQIPGRVEVVPALQQLHAIQGHAERRGDRAIYVACCALEAMVHLRSSVADRLEQAQRAIAAARSLQLQVTANELGSFGTLLDLIDIASGVAIGNPDRQKADALVMSILDKDRESGSSENGTFTVLIERSFGGNLTFDTGGVFRKNAERKDELVFSWLPMEDLRAVCFHISALDSHLHQKGMHYMNEAHQRFRESAKRRTITGIPPAVSLARIEWNLVLDWYSMFAIGLMACSHDDHTTVTNVLGELKKRISQPPYKTNAAFTRTLAYLTSINSQTNGALDAALSASSIPELSVPEKGHATPARTDIALLAALNRLLIIRNPNHTLHSTTDMLLQQIKPLAEDHPNQYLRTAFRLVHTFQGETAAISHQKNTVQRCVGIARQVGDKTQNFEFLAMIMCYFVARFFADSVGEKSVQAVLAARSQAIKNRRPVWKAVAAGLCVKTYRRHGGDVGVEVDAEGEEEDADGEVDADGDIDVVG